MVSVDHCIRPWHAPESCRCVLRVAPKRETVGAEFKEQIITLSEHERDNADLDPLTIDFRAQPGFEPYNAACISVTGVSASSPALLASPPAGCVDWRGEVLYAIFLHFEPLPKNSVDRNQSQGLCWKY